MTERAAETNPQTGHRPRMVWPFLLATIVVIVGVAWAGNLFRVPSHSFNGLQFDPVEAAPDFTLIDQHHQPVRLSDYRNQVVLLYFGFLNCPDECPLTMGIWKQVANLLGQDAARVRFVMITVDPDRDTPAKLGEYLAIFNPHFIGLSGSVEEIEDVAIPYNVFFKKLDLKEEEVRSAHVSGVEDDHADGEGHGHEEEHYLVNHTTLTFVIDPAGQLVLVFPLGTGAREIAADVRYLLQ